MRKNNQFWMDSYLNNCRLLNKSDRTLENYRADIKQFITWFESKTNKDISKARAITIGQYQHFLTHGGYITPPMSLIKRITLYFTKKRRVLRTAKYRPALRVNSRKRHLSTLRNFFDYLKQTHEDKSKLFLINPIKPKLHAVLVKDVDIEHTQYLRPGDWEKILEKTWRTKERLILLLLYHTGMRLHELCALTKESFSRKSGTITFSRKGGKIHTLKIKKGDEIFDQFEYMIKNVSEENKYLFTGKGKAPLSIRAMSNLIKQMIRRAGCDENLTPHSFRKACATNLYLTSKDLLYVRDYLGHSDAAVTQTYIDKNALHERHLLM